jgi:general stress protein CsbA
MALLFGNVVNAQQSMAKEYLMTAAIIVLVVCSLWLGYLLGSNG